MLETQNPVDVIAMLRTAQRLLADQAERLRGSAARPADYGNLGPTTQYSELVEAAADLGRLADLIAMETEQEPR